MKTYLFLLTIILNIFALPQQLLGQDDDDDDDTKLKKEFERTKSLIVMIKAEGENWQTFGAGIIVGRKQDELLIATTYHFLHNGNEPASKIEVEFRSKRGKLVTALIQKYSSDQSTDLALLSVKKLTAQGIDPCTFNFDKLSQTELLKPGKGVFPLGNPVGTSWAIPIAADKIDDVSGNNIIFQSLFIQKGNSGGALLDANGDIAGMIIADQPPFGRAIIMDSIITRIKNWGYPVQLHIKYENALGPLHIAASKGDLVGINNFIADCNGINKQDEHGAVPLHYAAGYADSTIVSILINSGAQINILDEDGDPPLEWAVESGKISIIKLLVKKGADISGKYRRGKTLLHVALVQGQTETAKYLILTGADVNSLYDEETPLGRAIQKNNTEIIDLLLKRNAKTSSNSLYYAVKNGNSDLIRKVVKSVSDINAELKADNRGTLLHYAVEQGDLEIIKLLVAAGANINANGYSTWTPLYMAVYGDRNYLPEKFTKNQSAIEDYLIQLGAGFKGVEKSSMERLLWDAVNKINVKAVKLVLNAGTDPNTRAGRAYVYSLLHTAIMKNNAEIVKLLIKAGADINEVSYGTTPTQQALKMNNTEVLKALIDAGADTDDTGSGGVSDPAEEAIEKGNLEVFKSLFKSSKVPDKENKFLVFASLNGQAEIVKYLLTLGAKAKNGFEPAITKGKIEVVKVLLNTKIDVNEEYNKDDKPLHLAAEYGQTEIMKLLIKAGANLNAVADNDTPMERAIQKGQLNSVKLLIEEGVSINVIKDNDESPLHVAVNEHQKDIVRYLLSVHAKIDATNVWKNTPLHFATKSYDDISYMQMLITSGANVNAKNDEGNTPLHLVIEENNRTVIDAIQLLIKAGADVNAKNNDGKTALSIALDDGRESIAKLLRQHGAKQ